MFGVSFLSTRQHPLLTAVAAACCGKTKIKNIRAGYGAGLGFEPKTFYMRSGSTTIEAKHADINDNVYEIYIYDQTFSINLTAYLLNMQPHVTCLMCVPGYKV